MAIVGDTSRSRWAFSRPSLVLLAAFVLLHVPVARAFGAEQQQEQRRSGAMPIPGGTARLLAAADIPVPAEPARAFLAIIRNSYSQRTAPKATIPPAVYLDAVTRLAAAGERLTSGRSDALVAFLEACGFDRRRNRPSAAAEVVERVRLLDKAGIAVGEWLTWWSESQLVPPEAKMKRAQDFAAAIGAADEIPALLPADLWSSAVFGRDVSASLAASILGDRRAALLYYGLFALDDETLAFVSRTPKLVSALAAAAGEFAAFSDGVVIRNGRVEVPGSAEAAPLWDAVVGAPSADPPRFVAALFARNEGRLAWLFDAIAHLDPPHQAFALSADTKDASARLEHLRRLADVFVTFERNAALIAEKPFARTTPDPGFILGQIRVTEDGLLAPPSHPAFWEAVLQPGGSRQRVGETVNAAWIVAQIAARPGATRRMWLDAVLFAQRLAAKQQKAGALVWPEQLAAAATQFATRSALMLTLERLGFTDPADYVTIAAATNGLSAGDERHASVALAQFQGALAVLVRLHDVGAIATPAALDLARSLAANASGERAVAAWFEGRLLPALPKAAAGPAAASLEDRLLDALAGLTADRSRPVVEWEGHPYRVDIAASERSRLRRIREQQGDVTVDDVIGLHRGAAKLLGAATPEEVAQGAEQVRQALARSNNLLSGNATLFGSQVPRLREAILSSLGAVVAQRFDSGRTDEAQRLSDATATLLADLLASLAYALATGDPEAPSLLAGNPARRHDFTLSMPSSAGWWRIAEETNDTFKTSGSRLVIRGSLLALDRALGREWLRPLTFDLPDIGRRMAPEEMRGLGEAVAALNGFRLRESDGTELVAALTRGRARLRAAAPVQYDSLARLAGVDGQRRRLLAWATPRDADAVWPYFSLSELLQLGMEQAPASEFRGWGLPSRPCDGGLDVRLPRGLAWQQMAGRGGALLISAQVFDLQLRVLETLTELRLPVALTPAVLAFATWDVSMSSPMTDPDDWLALVRTAQALPPDRIADYVWAFTVDGGLSPVEVK